MSFTQTVESAVTGGRVALECAEPGAWKIELTIRRVEPKIEIVRVRLENETETIPPVVSVGWRFYARGASNLWRPSAPAAFPPNWAGNFSSSITNDLPVYELMGADDRNRCSFTTSEARNHVEFKIGVEEETVEFPARFVFHNATPAKSWTTEIRFDARDITFADAVRDAVAWLEEKYPPCPVPEAAFDPLYSSWYNFHHDVHDDVLERECAEASRLGMKTLIVDNGWQSDNEERGCAHCGDWEISPRRFPDFRAHVERVHRLGMKYMLWYAVPFIGTCSENYERFRGKYLTENFLGAGVLDPRYPEVRDFLVDLYAKAMRDGCLDGLKLDFIDAIHVYGGEDPGEKTGYAGMTTKSIPEAVDILMKRVHRAVVAIKPDALFEFRQAYIGPAMRRYGNMLRAGDCPYDANANRERIVQLRLTSGCTAVHSDMLEWNDGDSPEFAALQILNVLFAVIQYSRKLFTMSSAHKAMVAHWIRFTQEHRATLLKGTFTPHAPSLHYPVVEAQSEEERIVVEYAPTAAVNLDIGAKRTILVNATTARGIASRGRSDKRWNIYDTLGARLSASTLDAVPPAGYAVAEMGLD